MSPGDDTPSRYLAAARKTLAVLRGRLAVANAIRAARDTRGARAEVLDLECAIERARDSVHRWERRIAKLKAKSNRRERA